jgi:hypothetical protein
LSGSLDGFVPKIDGAVAEVTLPLEVVLGLTLDVVEVPKEKLDGNVGFDAPDNTLPPPNVYGLVSLLSATSLFGAKVTCLLFDASVLWLGPLRNENGFDATTSSFLMAAVPAEADSPNATGVVAEEGVAEASKVAAGNAGVKLSFFPPVDAPFAPNVKVGSELKMADAEVEGVGVGVGVDLGALGAPPKTNGAVAGGFACGGLAVAALN